MLYDRRIHRSFPTDLAAATAYYDQIDSELGNRFRDSVRHQISTVTERPESFGVIRHPLRGAIVDGYPYLLLFRVVGEIVYFAGLYHASSDPDRWLDRLTVDG